MSGPLYQAIHQRKETANTSAAAATASKLASSFLVPPSPLPAVTLPAAGEVVVLKLSVASVADYVADAVD